MRFQIMIIHWLSLFVGLSLGFLPPRLLMNSECRYLVFEELWTKVLRPEQPSQRRRRWWKLPLVWIDPFRGYVTAAFLLKAFSPVAEASAFQRTLPLMASGVFLIVSLWLQTRGRLEERETVSPAGFLAGMMIAMLPPTVAIAAIVMGGATALAMQGYAAGYLVATVTTAGIGVAFMGKSQKLALVTVLVALPLLTNWLRGTRLVTPVRC